MIPVARTIENQDARNSIDHGDKSIDPREIAAFRKIGNTLNQLFAQAALTFQPVRLNAIFPSRIAIPT